MNSYGSYKCYCLNGYTLTPDGSCTSEQQRPPKSRKSSTPCIDLCSFLCLKQCFQTPGPAPSLTASMAVRRSRGRSAASAHLQGCSWDRMKELVLVSNTFYALFLYFLSSDFHAASERRVYFDFSPQPYSSSQCNLALFVDRTSNFPV